MKRLVVAGIVLLASVAYAQPADPGSGSAGSGSGSGSASKTTITLPTDMNAPTVNASASPTEVRLGGKFTVFIDATFAPGVQVNLQEPVNLGPAFEVRRKNSADTVQPDGNTTRQWQLEVIAWDLGDLRIAPIAVTYTAYGKTGQVQTNMIKLEVHGVLGDVVDDPKAMRSQHAPVMLQSRDLFWLWIALGAIILGGGIVAAVLIITNKGKDQPVRWIPGIARSRGETTAERALERLKQIEASGVLDREDDRKTGYTELAEVIRDYVGARYRVSTIELTTYELLRELRKVHAPAEDCTLIEAWLERCDMVKYGGLRASQTEAAMTLSLARELIHATTVPLAPATPVEPKPEAA